MKIKLNDAIISTDNCNFYNVYLLIIDEEDKSIDISDSFGMTIGYIYYGNEKEVIAINNKNNEKEFIDIVINGKVVSNNEKKISINEIKKLEEIYNCKLIELSLNDGLYYACFEDYIIENGKTLDSKIDKLYNELMTFDNIKFLTDNIYIDDFINDTFFQQVTVQWEKV